MTTTAVAVRDRVGVRTRKARLGDARRICQLINHFADLEEMLHRTPPEISEHIRDYTVAERGSQIVGCCALQVDLDSLAEVKGLAVAEEFQGMGVGKTLVRDCLDEAHHLGVPHVFSLTYRPGFFERLGFRQVPKSTLPRKVWGECIRCPKFPDCGEIAVMLDLAVESHSLPVLS